MRQADFSGQFKRDVKQSQKRGKTMGKLKTLLGLLIEGEPLPSI
jgi:mRNA interferase YafQ